jgi:uncharacterized protein with von Willebrand factor type A (vWA) domain
MTDESAPLLKAFYKLRERQFPLGVQDYLNALRAISRGYGAGSREKLIFMCQTLWAKSPDEQRQVAEVFELILPPTLSEKELGEYLNAVEKESGQHEETKGPDRHRAPEVAAPGPIESGKAIEDHQRPAQSDVPPAQNQPRLNFTAQSSPTGIDLPAPPVRDWPINPDMDFIGRLPITRRNMKASWRYLRLMRRTGQRVELDVPGTIEQTYKQGVLLEPVLMPRRTNQAQLLILTDEGGSMVPFRQTTQALLESAAQGGLRRVAFYFFHDVPLLYLFNNPLMSEKHAEEIDKTLENFSGDGVLILSDGGAARGNLDENRVKQTANFLKKLLERRLNLAWLNPVPAERWAGTTAEMICEDCGMRMMSYRRAGLDAAMAALRGKRL